MSTIQISMNAEREIQFGKVIAKRRDLSTVGSTEAARKLLFEAMDAIVPAAKNEEQP
jgi:hypothetical protein